jgi:hypothetical protein
MEALIVRSLVLALVVAGTASLGFAACCSVTVSLSNNTDNFTLTAGSASNPGSSSIAATTAWSLKPPDTLGVYAYFFSSAAALTDFAGHNIPSSAFYISDNGGASQAVTNSVPFGGANAGLQLESINIRGFNKVGSVIDNMTFNINLSALAQLPAGTYFGLLVIQAQAPGAGVNSNQAGILLTANLAESLTLSLSSGAVNFALAPGTVSNPGTSGITATTRWVLKASRSTVGVYAYFSNASAALTDGAGDNIPASAFFISDNGGASTALTQTVPFGGANAGLQLGGLTAITSANENSSRTDAMTFNINLSGGTLPQLPAGTYAGTLNIQAQATP